MDGTSLNSFKFNFHNQVILDSGATDHMFCNQNLLTNLEPNKNEQFVLVANGMRIKIQWYRRDKFIFN
jgi:hypothetical protein